MIELTQQHSCAEDEGHKGYKKAKYHSIFFPQAIHGHEKHSHQNKREWHHEKEGQECK
jgi:hypothetical protein